jgi:hypothetical protein
MQLCVEDTCVDCVDSPWRAVFVLSRDGKYVNREGILHGFYFISSHYTRVCTYNSVCKYVLVNERAAVSVMECYLVS